MKKQQEYFRADGHLIGQLVLVETLRYAVNNIATVVAQFSIPTDKGTHEVSVRFTGDFAESLSKSNPTGSWFEVKGRLQTPPKDDPEIKSPIFLSSKDASPLPDPAIGLFNCEIIGRLTKDPEEITKTNDFKFGRFSLAVNRETADKAQFFNISVFRPKLLEQVKGGLGKGKTIFAEGDLAFFKAGEAQNLNYSIKLDRYITFSD
jgi:Single-strand binding protein family